MVRKTITIHDFLHETIQEIRAKIFYDTRKEMSYTTIVNAMILGALIATEKMSEEDWETIRAFLKDESIKLEVEAGVDKIIEIAMSSLTSKRR